MTPKEMKDAFDRVSDEHGRFCRIVNPRHPRPDICAFMLLHDLDSNSGRDMVAVSRHDEIILAAQPDVVANVITEEQIVTLVRCGVSYSDFSECFYLMV